MQFITIVAAFAAAASANPLSPLYPLRARQLSVCGGTYNTPQCCAVDVLGLADLQCANPPSPATNQTYFVNECAALGQQARCCALPVLDQALLCGDPLTA